MATLTLVAQPDQGRVRLELSFTGLASVRQCFIYRIVAGVETLIRGGDPLILSNLIGVVYDTELPLDVPVQYRAIAYLNINSTFESGVVEWDNGYTTGTVSQSSDFAYSGFYSARLVPDGSSSYAATESEEYPAVVGTSYTASMRYMSASLWTNVRPFIDWFTAGSIYISSSYGTANGRMGEWVLGTVTAVAPATTAFSRVGIEASGTPPTSAVVYLDDATVTTPLATVTSSVVQINSNGVAWLKNPQYPAYDTSLRFSLERGCRSDSGIFLVALSGDQRQSDSSNFEVPGATRPVNVWSARKDSTGTIRLFTRTAADRARVRSATSGAPLLLQLPPAYQEDPRYMAVGDVSESRIHADHKVAWRLHEAPYAQVDPPVGPAEGVDGNRYTDLDRFSTYGAAQSAAITWFDVMQAEASL